MRGVTYLIFPLLIFFLSFSSCTSECSCSKQLGCAILTVKKLNGVITNTVITTKTFCSQKDYYGDWVVQDSINAFRKRYTTDTTYVDVKDSIYKQYETVWVKHNMRRYTDSGYSCNCPR